MGTSSSYGGPKGSSPLVPSWVAPISPVGSSPLPSAPPSDATPPVVPGAVPSLAAVQPPLQAQPDRNRFRGPRTSFSRFAKSGGSNGGSLGRAVARYVSHSSGGARRAAQKMGASRTSAARLVGFLADVQSRGTREALRALDLERLAGRPVEEIFVGLMEFVCPRGGSVDEGIARDAFIKTVEDLSDVGIIDLDTLTPAQMQTVLELYATHAIEDRLCNEIGTKAIALPKDVKAVEATMDQLRDFVRGSVSNSIERAQAALTALTVDRVQAVIDSVYETAFAFLQAAGELAAGEA
ncbi:MAG: hypothetical protein JSU08_01315 [Acidobacteria bacterium]|nr:hypothetical protein [Acidobacteriota bacterium]